jgi:hypothetical protein
VFKELLNDSNLLVFADIVMYLNSAGIIYILIHSIYQRRMLVSLNIELDKDHTSPSDFAILARNLPKNIT